MKPDAAGERVGFGKQRSAGRRDVSRPRKRDFAEDESSTPLRCKRTQPPTKQPTEPPIRGAATLSNSRSVDRYRAAAASASMSGDRFGADGARRSANPNSTRDANRPAQRR